MKEYTRATSAHRCIIILAVISLSFSCGDTEEADPGAVGDSDVVTSGTAGTSGETIIGVPELPPADGEGDGADSSDGENSGTGGDDDGMEDPNDDLPEDFNKACEENIDCETGYCLPGPDGKVCTSSCIDWCPKDWSCEAVSNFGADITFICVPKFVALCTPCESDSDCKGYRCLEIEDEGSFCSRECNLDDPCPKGYTCKIVDDATNQCFPITGSCICDDELLGQQETCIRDNSFGICKGFITCSGPGGWSECDAKIPAQEVCDGWDNDCDGELDENTGGASCEEVNENGACQGNLECHGADGLICSAKVPAVESCDKIDNNCDGTVDEPNAEGCSSYFEDFDKDGVGNSLTELCLCGPDLSAKWTATEGGDCNDLDPNVTGGKTEICNNLDDDCDGVVDPAGSTGCIAFYEDVDGDGFGTKGETQCLCQPQGAWKALVGGDCNDKDATVFPTAQELCNQVDDNCNGSVDETGATGCTPFLKDADGDGFGVNGLAMCLCEPTGVWKATEAGDCNDANAELHPNAIEICDDIDNNCNGFKDEDCDKDNDGYCNADKTVNGNPDVCPLGGGDCVDYDSSIHPNAKEACDGVDNDCNGEVDEGVKAPCGGCEPVCLMGAGPKDENTFQDNEENLDGAGFDENGNVILDASSIKLHMIWIANSGQGSISKLDTATGKEVARYQLCDDPSRTAVDSQGNAWIACRGDARVVKVALSENECIDKNGDGVIQTSKDINGNGVIDGAEMLGKDQDECVVFAVQPNGSDGKARAMGVDKDDHGWVGMWNTKKLFKIHKDTGKVLKEFNLPNNPYGMAIAKDGIIWIAGRGGSRLLRVDPKTGEMTQFNSDIGCLDPYGIAIDINGRVWIGNCCCSHVAYRFDPQTHKWDAVSVKSRPRGIAADNKGFIYVANDQSNHVAKINVDTLKVEGWTDLGAGRFPVGMAVDFDGKVWAINQQSSTATRIDPDTMEIMLEKPTGPSPYTYSDMTGFAQKTVVAPFGKYTHTFKGWEGGKTKWQQVGFNATTPEGTWIKVRVRVYDDADKLDEAQWSPIWGPFPPELQPINLNDFGQVIGKFLQVEVTLGSEKGAKQSPILKSLDIVASKFGL